MNRWLFICSLSLALTAARAELAVDAPVETPTSPPAPAISVPAPRRAVEETNAVVAAAPAAKPAAPRAAAAQPWQRLDAPAAGNDSLTFTNGDPFTGVFLGLEKDVIHWQSTLLKAPVRLRAAGLDEVTLGVGLQTILPPPVRWLVVLTDGSLLPARHLTFEDGKVAADFAYAGAARLERGHVAALRRCDETAGGLVTLGDAPLYAPARKAKDTNAPGPRMRYRDAKLPDPFLLEFPWDGCRRHDQPPVRRLRSRHRVRRPYEPAPATAGGRPGRRRVARHIVLREWREDSHAPAAVRPRPTTPRAPGEARVILSNGDFLTLKDLAADERTVTGRHALLGPLTLNRAGVRVLDWVRAPER